MNIVIKWKCNYFFLFQVTRFFLVFEEFLLRTNITLTTMDTQIYFKNVSKWRFYKNNTKDVTLKRIPFEYKFEKSLLCFIPILFLSFDLANHFFLTDVIFYQKFVYFDLFGSLNKLNITQVLCLLKVGWFLKYNIQIFSSFFFFLRNYVFLFIYLFFKFDNLSR